MLIRDRAPEDAPALESIARQTHQLDRYPVYPPDDLQSFIVDPGALGAWVAADDGEVLGHVALHPRSSPEVMDAVASATGLVGERVAVIARLLVAPAARRRGTGRALLERGASEAARLGRRAVLDVVDQHTAAIALYEDCGWTRVGSVEWMLPGDLPLREFLYVSPETQSPETYPGRPGG